MSTVPSFAVVDRQNGRFDVINIVRSTAASWFDANGTRWIRDSGLMYGAGNYGARIVSHHATPEAAWAEATERAARAQVAQRDYATRTVACESIRRDGVGLAYHAPTARIVLIAEVIGRLATDAVDDATAERVRDILRGVE